MIKITVKVTPRSRKNEIVSWEDGILKVRLRAIPEKGEANTELIAFLSDVLDIPKSMITIVHGTASRIKHIELLGLSETDFLNRLK
jgi:hypothetical protein